MSTIRWYNVQNISADTGVVVIQPANVNQLETMAQCRIRLTCNTAQLPYAGGQLLATVTWFDGVGFQTWNVACNTDTAASPGVPPTYAEQGLDIWHDWHQPITIQVQPTVAGGSVDVLLLADDS